MWSHSLQPFPSTRPHRCPRGGDRDRIRGCQSAGSKILLIGHQFRGYVMEVQPANPVGRAQFKHEFGVQLHRQSHLWQERQAPAESDSNVPRTGVVKVEKAWDIGEQLTATEQQRLRDLLDMHPNAFARSMEDLGRYKGAPMTIELTTTEPVYKRRHRLSKVEWELVEKRCQELLNAGLIEVSTSDFAAPTVMPAKKDAFGQYTDKRMCGDYRALNNVTRMDRYPMPTPEEIFDEVGEAKVFSILDLRQGFQQIVIQEDDRAKTAFWGASNLLPVAYDAVRTKERASQVPTSDGSGVSRT